MSTTYDEKKKLWFNSTKSPLYDPSMLLGQQILTRLSIHDQRVMQINADTGKRTTFHEMWLNTIRIAQNLQRRGFKSREVFSFMSNYNDHLIATIFASICLTCPISPLHETLSKNELVNILRKTKPSIIFCDANAIARINEALGELELNVKIFVFGECFGDFESVENLLIETGEEHLFVPMEYDVKNDVAAIYCSSGTTGPSKCVCISYENSKFLPSVSGNGGVVLSTAPIFWGIIEEYKVTDLFCSPFKLIPILKTELIYEVNTSSIKSIICTGGKLVDKFITDVIRYFPNAVLSMVYGSTEIGVISTSILTANSTIPRAQLYYECSVKIVASNGDRCGPNINGEICVQKPNQFFGYLDDPEATANAFDNEGFFRTGDRGHFDDDGHLIFEDRIKSSIRLYYFALTILPSEIEDHLLSIPDIEEVCVVGIPIDNEESLLAAVVVRKTNSTLLERDVFNIVAKNFPHRSKLRGGVYFVDALPKTISGKIVRRKVCDLATEWFKMAKETDPDIQLYLSDIPGEYRKFI